MGRRVVSYDLKGLRSLAASKSQDKKGWYMTVIYPSSSEHFYIWHVSHQKIWEAIQVLPSIEAQEKAFKDMHEIDFGN